MSEEKSDSEFKKQILDHLWKVASAAFVPVFTARWFTGWAALAYLQSLLLAVLVVTLPIASFVWLKKGSGARLATVASTAFFFVIMTAGSFSFWKQLSPGDSGSRCPEGEALLLQHQEIRGTRANVINLRGEPLVIVDRDTGDLAVTLSFEWEKADAIPMGRDYEGKAMLKSGTRAAVGREELVLDPFRVSDISFVPTSGFFAYEFGWIEILTLMAEVHFVERWLDGVIGESGVSICR